MASLQLKTGPPALLAGRHTLVCPSVHVLRSVPTSKLRNARPAFRSGMAQRIVRAEAAVAEADTGSLPEPVAEVVKRLQGKVYIAGISGQLASRVVKELLQAGVSVIAGVPEDDPAAEALSFALQFELIKKQEASKLQLREIDFADANSYGIPRGATVLIALGDVQGKRKMDARVVEQAVAAAAAAGAGRIVLATPLGGGGGGGLFSGFFGGAPSSSGTGELRLSRTEQQVYDSGIPFSIVRLGAPPNDAAPPAGAVELTSAGDTSKSAQLTRSQAAKVVAEVLQQAGPGDNVVLEAGLSAAALEKAIPNAVAEILPEALIEAEEEEEESAPAPAAAASAPFQRAAKQAASAVEDVAQEAEEAAPEAAQFDLKSLFGGGGRKAQQQAEEVEEEVEEVVQQAAKPFKSFFGGGGRAKAADIEKEAEEVAEQAAKPFKSLFGGKPKQAKQEVQQDARQAKKIAYEARRQASSAGRQAASAVDRGAKQLTGGTKRASNASVAFLVKTLESLDSSVRTVARGVQAEARQPSGNVFRSMLGLDEEKDEAEEKPKGRWTLGGSKGGRWTLGGTKRVSAKPKQQQSGRAAGSGRATGKGKQAQRPARKAKQAVARGRPAARQGEEEPQQKKGGFLGALGFGQQTVYADED